MLDNIPHDHKVKLLLPRWRNWFVKEVASLKYKRKPTRSCNALSHGDAVVRDIGTDSLLRARMRECTEDATFPTPELKDAHAGEEKLPLSQHWNKDTIT
jgi:hypothetical protein